MDIFKTLPAEAIQLIITQTDFVGLESLLAVCPYAQDVFNINTAAVTRGLLASCPILSCNLYPLFQKVASIRRYSESWKDLNDYEAHTSDTELDAITASPDEETVRTLQGMVHVCANIQRVACVCLSMLLRRLRCVTPYGCSIDESGNIFSITPCLTKDTGPASWMEEYRIYRTLWHVQLYTDLQNAGIAPKSIQPWSRPSYMVSFDYEPWEGGDSICGGYFDTIAELLHDLAGSKPDPHQLVPIPAFSSLSNHQTQTIWSPPAAPGDEGGNFYWERGVERAEFRSSQCGLYIGHTLSNGRGPITVPADVICDTGRFRRLGLFIWDLWRMYCLGLTWCDEKVPTPDGGFAGDGPEVVSVDELLFRWFSMVEDVSVSYQHLIDVNQSVQAAS